MYGPGYYYLVGFVIIVVFVNFIIAIVVDAFETSKMQYISDKKATDSIPTSLRHDFFERVGHRMHVRV
jgi:hypothetical protein